MDMLILTLVFIIVLCVISVMVYILYDYNRYKTNVDKSFDIASNQFNEKMSIVENNIDNTKKHFSQKLSDISRVNAVTDSIENLNKLDLSLKNYFKFRDNGEELVNEKLHEHIFSGINPNLELLTKVNTTNGLIVKTPEFLYDDRNLKICDIDQNCVSLNVNSSGFNIIPDNINDLTIKSNDRTDLVNFDLKNKKIFLGGSDTQSPLYIQDDTVFMKDLNMTRIVDNVDKIEKYKRVINRNI